MIVDLRIYTCLPNRVAEFVELYEKMGWPLQQKHLGNCVGWYTTIEGSLNTVVHMWGGLPRRGREARHAGQDGEPHREAGTVLRVAEEVRRRGRVRRGAAPLSDHRPVNAPAAPAPPLPPPSTRL